MKLFKISDVNTITGLFSFELPSALMAKSLINLLQTMLMLPHGEYRWTYRDGL